LNTLSWVACTNYIIILWVCRRNQCDHYIYNTCGTKYKVLLGH
jgi:hypothetical protein